MKYEYKKTLPEEIYISVIDRQTTEKELWLGYPAKFTGNLPTENAFINLYANLVRKYQFLDSKDYAKMLGLTSNDFSATIRTLTGLNPNDWRDRYVMLSAYDLLRLTNMNMTEVSKRLGFTNPSIFSRYFKAHTKLTPTIWRKRNK